MSKTNSYTNMGLTVIGILLLIGIFLNWDKPAGSTFSILLLVVMFNFAAGQIIIRLDLIIKELQNK